MNSQNQLTQQNCLEEAQVMLNVVTKASFVNTQSSVLLRLLSNLPKQCIVSNKYQKESKYFTEATAAVQVISRLW